MKIVKLSEKRIEDIRSQIEVRQIEANEVLAAEEVSTKREKELLNVKRISH